MKGEIMSGARKVPYGFWTKQRIKQEAAKFATIRDFYKAYPSAYRQARRLKIVKEVCGHLTFSRKRPY